MTGNPSEYLKLPAGGASNYIYKGTPGNSASWGKPCRGEFNKVRLILTYPLKILRSKVTFMVKSDPKCSPLLRNNGKPTAIEGYGGAGDCTGIGASIGEFHVNLSGTLFKIPSKIS